MNDLTSQSEKRHKPVKILIHGWYGHGNAGDEAILFSIGQSLKSVFKKIDMTVLSSNPKEVFSSHGINSVDDNFLRFKSFKMALNKAKESDLLIIGGGGLFFDTFDRILPIGVIRWSKALVLAKLANKPIMIYGLGIGPVRLKLSKLLLRFFLKEVDCIAVRDEESKELVNELIKKNVAHLTADPAISILNHLDSLEEVRIPFPKDKLLIGLCLRQYKDFNTESKEVIDDLIMVLDQITSKYNAFIVLFPLESMESRYSSRDQELLDNIRRNIGNSDNVILISEPCNYRKMMGIISRMDLIIGMRLHSLIFSAAFGVPMYGIIYDPKVKNFLDRMGQLRYSIDLEDFNPNKVLNDLNEMIQHLEDIRKDIIHRREGLIGMERENYELAMNLISNRKQSEIDAHPSHV